MNEKILVVEDNVDISKAINLYLSNAGYQVTLAHDGQRGFELFNDENFDLCLVDLMLPMIDGMELVKLIREKSEAPIIIVSAKNDEIDKIEGLSLGADDYITKPFSPPELLARVNSAIRRWNMMKGKTQAPSKLSIDALTLDTQTFQLYKGEILIDLTATEYKILKLFMEHPNQIFSKKQICELVNGEYFESDEKVIIVHVSHIRDKIGLRGNGDEYIKTIRGLGYKIEK